MDEALHSLYAVLDAAVFECLEDSRLRLLTDPPRWLSGLLRDEDLSGPLELRDRWPFLDHFLEQAAPVWAGPGAEPEGSGTWVETDAEGREVPLEATAVHHAGRRLLFVRALGRSFEIHAEALQAARESLLTKERLELEVRRQTEYIRRREEEVAMRLVEAISIRDDETGGHIRRIGRYASTLARRLGWSADRVDDIAVAAPMHDIGKIGVPDRILLKPGRLTPEERVVMERHAEIGARMLEGDVYPLLSMACEIAWCHHENWDGSGYPRGMNGEAIPVAARITAIVDVYDAMTHARVYKPAVPEDAAVAHMRGLAGTKFDPAILEAFFDLLPEMRRIREEIPDEPEAVLPSPR